MKEINHVDWVRLACSADGMRPVLTGLHVTDSLIEATDGHRLHLVKSPCGLLPGLHAKDCRQIEGTYPNTYNGSSDGR